MAKTLIIENLTANTLQFAKIDVPGNTTLDLIAQGVTIRNLTRDECICPALTAGDIRVNDGTNDMADAAAAFQLIACLVTGV